MKEGRGRGDKRGSRNRNEGGEVARQEWEKGKEEGRRGKRHRERK